MNALWSETESENEGLIVYEKAASSLIATAFLLDLGKILTKGKSPSS